MPATSAAMVNSRARATAHHPITCETAASSYRWGRCRQRQRHCPRARHFCTSCNRGITRQVGPATLSHVPCTAPVKRPGIAQ